MREALRTSSVSPFEPLRARAKVRGGGEGEMIGGRANNAQPHAPKRCYLRAPFVMTSERLLRLRHFGAAH
eukprot:5722469-Pyramimonas_sp.AAC.1